MFEKLERQYFGKSLSQGFVSLYTGRTIMMIGGALLGLFLPIFLYELFNKNFVAVVLYYSIGFFAYGITITLGAKFLNRFGFKKALQVSVFLAALFYFIFYLIDKNGSNELIPLTILILVLFRLFHWLPYHVDFAKFSDKKNRAKQVSILKATSLSLGIFIPLISGLIISKFGFDILFVIAIVIYLSAIFPYMVVPRTREKFSWTIRQTWEQFFSKKRRNMIFAYMADGAENMVGLVVWPIFIYQLLNGNYFQIGILSTLIISITVTLQLFAGKYIDSKISKERAVHWGSVLYAFGWIIKIFITTAFQMFIVGAYHSITSILLRTPFDTLTYEIASDQGHYVDEFTVLREMAINIGRSIMGILIILVSFYFAMQWVFVLAAMATIIFNLLEQKDVKLNVN
ncbi:MAG: MFS transporter [Candidatus Portnoybacteria bacterium]|nr:MFS transporter [Candidatus Portnoybacteria bacterium]